MKYVDTFPVVHAFVPTQMDTFAAVAPLIFADTVMFPIIFLNGGLIFGFCVRLADEDQTGTWNLFYVSKISSISANIGRCLGPGVSRFVLEESGRGSYSILLAAVLFTYLLGYKVFVDPPLRIITESSP